MSRKAPPKGNPMRATAPAQERSKVAERLQELRIKSACTVHKTEGDVEEIRAEGLRVYEALEKVRERANQSCK